MGAAADKLQCISLLWDGEIHVSYFTQQTGCYEHPNYLRLGIERPTETAMLLSLTGVRSIIANQWYTTLQENAERLEILSENLLSIGRTTGQTVHILQKNKIHRERDSIKMEADAHSSPRDKAEEQTIHTFSNLPATHPSFFNCVLYGLPNIIIL